MIRFAIPFAVAAAAVASPAAAASDETFYLVNRTGYTIEYVYLAPTRSSDWQEDVLDTQVLVDGETFEIDMSRSEDACLWDLKVIYDDEDQAEWREINLCEMSTVVLHYSNARGTWATSD